ncbi:uncharacterized protein LOC109594708 [Aethina tumida]|uniref:uncharacterized protein LOC109594708 n=1 Tax=Aethina tumida TaxID=116153 RepID=UPI00096B2527|nr:uncharacterized protein LOC109594708 [Aethina tumida]
MRGIIVVLAMVLAVTLARYVRRHPADVAMTRAKIHLKRNINDPELFKQLGDFFHRMHSASIRCSPGLLDEGCSNGGIPGSGTDADWINNYGPGKRCVNILSESCDNGGIPGAGSDDDWIHDNSPGKRCANILDEGCNNGGVPGSGSDADWINNNSPGK